MEVDLSSIMVSAPPEASAPADKLPEIPEREVPKETTNTSKDTSTDENWRELATQIRHCFEEFPEKLATLKKTKLEGKSLKELQKIWAEIEYIMGAKQNLKLAVGGTIMTVKTVEDLVCQFTPLKIQGLHQVCNDPDILDDLKFCLIKSTGKISTTPEQRLGMRFLISAYALHRMNSSVPGPPAPAEAVTQAEIVDTDPKFADL
jgi:hypothetical protein